MTSKQLPGLGETWTLHSIESRFLTINLRRIDLKGLGEKANKGVLLVFYATRNKFL